MKEFFYFWVLRQDRLHIGDEFSLNGAFPIEIELLIERCGLDIGMSQVIFDIGDGLTLIEHIDCTGVTEPVNGVEVFDAFGGNCPGKNQDL